MKNPKAPLEISARHIHLSKEDAEKLFGKNYELKIRNKISQPGQFAAEETVSIVNGKNKIDNVRIVGPLREETQIEISKTDAFKLKVEAPLRISGDLDETPGITLIRGKKKIKTRRGLIIAKRHLHISDLEARELKLKNNQKIKIKFSGERALIFEEVIVRSGKNYELSVHLDSDEGNAAGISGRKFGEILL